MIKRTYGAATLCWLFISSLQLQLHVAQILLDEATFYSPEAFEAEAEERKRQQVRAKAQPELSSTRQPTTSKATSEEQQPEQPKPKPKGKGRGGEGKPPPPELQPPEPPPNQMAFPPPPNGMAFPPPPNGMPSPPSEGSQPQFPTPPRTPNAPRSASEEALQAAADAQIDSACPVPPYESSYKPELRTALASHPRAGSTWFRFVLERAAGLPTGCERPSWANVLAHVGGETDPKAPNKEGIVVKTHSCCHGCWPDADMQERATLERNTTYTAASLRNAGVDKTLVKALSESGNCLTFPPAKFSGLLQQYVRPHPKPKFPPEVRERMRREEADILPCQFVYDRAIVLHRDPLDVIRSNYHYRTDVLKMRPPNTWAKDDYDFPFERGDSFVKFYWSWKRFADFKPTLEIRYEDMKAEPLSTMQKVLSFLGRENVPDAQINCAVQSTSMRDLKQAAQVQPGVDAGKFFGSRADTTSKEDLTYPRSLLKRFKNAGLMHVRSLLGYGARDDVPGLDAFLDSPTAKIAARSRDDL